MRRLLGSLAACAAVAASGCEGTETFVPDTMEFGGLTTMQQAAVVTALIDTDYRGDTSATKALSPNLSSGELGPSRTGTATSEAVPMPCELGGTVQVLTTFDTGVDEANNQWWTVDSEELFDACERLVFQEMNPFLEGTHQVRLSTPYGPALTAVHLVWQIGGDAQGEIAFESHREGIYQWELDGLTGECEANWSGRWTFVDPESPTDAEVSGTMCGLPAGEVFRTLYEGNPALPPLS